MGASIEPEADVASWKFDMTPVDWAASVISSFAVHFPNYCLGDILHIQTPHEPLVASEVLPFLGKLCNETVLPFSEWRTLLSDSVANEEKFPASSKDGMILRKLYSSLDSTASYLANSIDFCCSNLNKKIEVVAEKEKTSLVCPLVSLDTIQQYFLYEAPKQ